MLTFAFVCFVISLIAGFVGFSGLSSAAAGVAKVLFFAAATVFVVLVALALFSGSLIL